MINLRSFQRVGEVALSDLLSYAATLDNGVVLNKDGSFTASWRFWGPDDASMTAEDRNVVNDRLNRAFRELGSGWCLHVNALRRRCSVYPDAVSHFPDPISELIDLERRDYFQRSGNSYETVNTLSLTYLPPVSRRWENLFFSTEKNEPSGTLEGDVRLRDFQRAIRDFEDNLTIALPARRLKSRVREIDGVKVEFDEQLELIEECLTGKYRRVRMPDCGMFVDSMLGQYPLLTGTVPRLGDEYLTVVHIAGFPPATRAGLLNPLLEMGIDFRWSTRFIPLDPWQARNEIRAYTRKWSQQVFGILASLTGRQKGTINQRALDMKHDGEQAASQADGAEVLFGYYTGNIVLFHQDRERLTAIARSVRKAVMNLGLGARVEDVNAVEAWLGSLPANTWANVRRPLLHSLNCVDLCPTSSVYAGEPFCPSDKFPAESPPLAILRTSGSTPFRLNLHVEDLGHTLIFGPTGAGKSTLLAFLSAQMLRYRNVRVFAFDRGHSLFAVNQAVDGRHYQVGGQQGLALAPLAHIATEDDLLWCCHWIETLLVLDGLKPDAGQRQEIRESLVRHREGEHHSLRDYTVQVQDFKIKSVLTGYYEIPIYNAASDALAGNENPFSCFEIEQLMNLPPHRSLPILLYLFRRIEQSLTGQPAFIVIDEAWQVLGHEVFRGKLTEWLRVLRKANAAVVLATQSLSDAANSGILDVLQEACPTRIYLPNPSANLEEFADRYRRLGLNRAQRGIIAGARPKRDYYVTSPLGDRLVELELGAIALTICGANSKEDVAAIRKEQAQSGKSWVTKWLRHKTRKVFDALSPDQIPFCLLLWFCLLWGAPGGEAAGWFQPESEAISAENRGRWAIVATEGESRLTLQGKTAAPWTEPVVHPYWEIPEGGVIPRRWLWDERRLCAAAGVPFSIKGWGQNHLAVGRELDPLALIDARPIESTPAGKKYDDPWRAITLHDQTLTGKLWALLRHLPGYRSKLSGLDLQELNGRLVPRMRTYPSIQGRLRPPGAVEGPPKDYSHVSLAETDRQALLEAEQAGMMIRTNRSGTLMTYVRSAHIRSKNNEPVSVLLAILELQAASPQTHRWRYDQKSQLDRALANLPLIPNPDAAAVAEGWEEAFIEVEPVDYWEVVLRLGRKLRETAANGSLQAVAFSGPGGSQLRTSDFLTWLVAQETSPPVSGGPTPEEVRTRGFAANGEAAEPIAFLNWFEAASEAGQTVKAEADEIRRLAEGLSQGRGGIPLETMIVQAVISVLSADYVGALFAFFGGRMTEHTQARNEGHWIALEVTERGLVKQGRRNLEGQEQLKRWSELAETVFPGPDPVASVDSPLEALSGLPEQLRLLGDWPVAPESSERYDAWLAALTARSQRGQQAGLQRSRTVAAEISAGSFRQRFYRERNRSLRPPEFFRSALGGGAVLPASRSQAIQLGSRVRHGTVGQLIAQHQWEAGRWRLSLEEERAEIVRELGRARQLSRALEAARERLEAVRRERSAY